MTQATNTSTSNEGASTSSVTLEEEFRQLQLTDEKSDRHKRFPNYVHDAETIANDNSTHYAITGERPQNFIRGSRLDQSEAHQPRSMALFRQKALLLQNPLLTIPPTYYEMKDINAKVLEDLKPNRFDVILITPPGDMTPHELESLNIPSISSSPGFIWLWIGSGQPGSKGIGITEGQKLLEKWGYRRCENIAWLKPGIDDVASQTDRKHMQDKPLFVGSVEHCLVGIKGTVRRSSDSWFVHCNIDTDVIVWAGDPDDPDMKPSELQSIIENFCLGTRRLHLFASAHSLRRGWLSIGSGFGTDPRIHYQPDLEFNVMDPVAYNGPTFKTLWNPKYPSSMPRVLPEMSEIESLRPKSPPRHVGQSYSGGLGRRDTFKKRT